MTIHRRPVAERHETTKRRLFAGVALEGATLREDPDDNATLDGKKLENSDTVTKGVRAPKAAAKLLEC